MPGDETEMDGMRCIECDYDLRGHADIEQCPECGAETTAAREAWQHVHFMRGVQGVSPAGRLAGWAMICVGVMIGLLSLPVWCNAYGWTKVIFVVAGIGMIVAMVGWFDVRTFAKDAPSALGRNGCLKWGVRLNAWGCLGGVVFGTLEAKDRYGFRDDPGMWRQIAWAVAWFVMHIGLALAFCWLLRLRRWLMPEARRWTGALVLLTLLMSAVLATLIVALVFRYEDMPEWWQPLRRPRGWGQTIQQPSSYSVTLHGQQHVFSRIQTVSVPHPGRTWMEPWERPVRVASGGVFILLGLCWAWAGLMVCGTMRKVRQRATRD